MTEDKMKVFIDRVKIESGYHRFLKEDVIYQLINLFNNDYQKIDYSNTINNPLTIALNFYQHYNKQYYDILQNAIKNGKIIINQDNTYSYTNTQTNITYITFTGNDSDLFMLVHEFAHFIDRNCNPVIIPDKYNFLCEVFSFYMEKQLELWLKDIKYKELIETRKNNRLYFEAKMMKMIEYELYCETLYKQTGKIDLDDLDTAKVKPIMKYNYDLNIGIINYLLRYPLANILSNYLINNHLIKNDYAICEICLNTNLYDLLKDFKWEKTDSKII